jgi:general secretion pathway protein L
MATPSWLDGQLRRTAPRAANTLELFLPAGWPEREGPLYWCMHTSAGVAHGEAARLADLPANLKWTQLTAWTPPADTLLTHASLPTRSARKVAQALPYALEDQLLGDPEDLHFAYQRQDDGALAVAVTARQRLQAWLQALREARVQPAWLCPATLALPLDVDDWALAFVDDWCWVRTGLYSGFVCPGSLEPTPALLQAALQEARERQQFPVQLTVFNAPPEFSADRWSTALGLVVTTAQTLWGQRPSVRPPLNLLQGEFAPTRGLRVKLRPLLPAAAMLALWLTGSAVFSLWEWWQLRQAYYGNQEAMVSLFRQTFPDAKTVLDPALQLQRNLEALRGQSGSEAHGGLLGVLAHVAPALATDTRLTLRTLIYADGKLTLDLQMPDFEALEKIKNAMNASGRVSVEVLAANSQQQGVEGRLRISTGSDTGGHQ